MSFYFTDYKGRECRLDTEDGDVHYEQVSPQEVCDEPELECSDEGA